MNWFKKTRRRARVESDASRRQPPDRVAELANRLGASGHVQDLERQLPAWKDQNLSQRELVSWHVLWIAVASRRDDRHEAFNRAQEAMRALPDEPEILFAIGQEHEYNGNIDEMVRSFQLAMFPKVSAAHALAETRYCYLHGRFDAGLELLQPVLDVHFALGIADDTFLWIRGMPFATITFATAACLQLLIGDPAAAISLLGRSARELTDCDLSSLKPFIEAHEQAAPRIAIAALEAASSHLSAGPLGGLQGIQLATWQSRNSHSVEEADAILNRVSLRETDFPWLNDVRTLAQAEACERCGDPERERALIHTFVDRQPLLFEPHWALEFGFIRYQERVRTMFWPGLTGRGGRATEQTGTLG